MFKAYFIDYQSPSSMYKELSKTKYTETEVRVDLIKEVLNKMKKVIENVPKDDVLKIEENDIVERILELNNKTQSGQGLKIITPNQMLSRLPISLPYLKAENNSEKLKNEIRQILCSLYILKKLTKTIYNNSINTI